jgi:hypothetical protein
LLVAKIIPVDVQAISVVNLTIVDIGHRVCGVYCGADLGEVNGPSFIVLCPFDVRAPKYGKAQPVRDGEL